MRRITIGNGTSASCTETAIRQVLDEGGSLLLTFNCGRGIRLIQVTTALRILDDTTIDGGGRIWLSGGNRSQMFHVFDSLLDLRSMILLSGRAEDPSGSYESSGGAINANNADIRLNRVNFLANYGRAGGALSAQNSTITIVDSIFQNNTADMSGGALLLINSTTTLTRVTFRRNAVPNGNGGALDVSRGSLTLDTVIVDANRSSGFGGGLSVEGGELVTLRDSEFTGNAADTGGGLSLRGAPGAVINTQFSSNTAARGGGIDAYTSDPGGFALLIDNSTFLRNSATGDRPASSEGGALRIGAYITAAITNSRFQGNSAFERGAAISSNGRRLEVSSSEFRRNSATATDRGSIVLMYMPVTGSFSNVRFFSNDARSTWVNLGDATLRDGVFAANTGNVDNAGRMIIENSQFLFNRRGGILSNGEGNGGMELVVRNSRFVSNGWVRTGEPTPIAGGIILFDGGDGRRFNGRALIEDSRFIANNGLAGAIYNRKTAARIENSLFMRNSGVWVGGIWNERLERSQVEIIQSTFASNNGGAIGNQGIASQATLINSIVQDSTETCDGPWTFLGVNLQFGSEACGGVGVFDPRLDTAGRPGLGSPAIDAATSGTCLPDDIDDTPRPQGAACDIGAYELGMASAPVVIATPAPTATLPQVPTQAPPTATPRPAVDCTSLRPTSPLDGLPNGVATFYWDGAPGATGYRVLVFNEQGAQVAVFEVSGGATSIQGDVSSAAVGGGFSFRWQVQALLNGAAICTSQAVSMLRATIPDAPPPPPVPQCGNGIQEPGETPNTCPNGY
jgi:hypothetical protein